jgi:predicted enzyme related to lactoylglutathione lyase
MFDPYSPEPAATNHRRNSMENIKVIVYPVQDLARAKTLYSTFLGVAPYADSPYYVGFKADGIDIGLDPNAHGRGITGPVVYLQVDNIQHRLQSLLEMGAQELQAVTDTGNGRLIASVKDSDGNIIGLLQDP